MQREIAEEYDLDDEVIVVETKPKEDTKPVPKIKTSKPRCPECGGELRFEGGCNTCPECGYSKCN